MKHAFTIEFMRRPAGVMLVLLCAALAGCASTIRSEVTAFHEWPVDLGNRSFSFARTPEQENDLEYRSYESLVRNELARLGFSEANPAQAAGLKVGIQYSLSARDVRVVEPVFTDPFYGPAWGPFFGPRWSHAGFYSPFYDPFWYAQPTQMIERNFQVFTRRLRIPISRSADGKMLYDVTVNSEGTNGSLPAVMPYLVRSAFEDFPGKNGVPRRVELKMTQ
jgi:hypothetical protein